MLSRVADRIFWMSRQMERAENMARILGVTSDLAVFGTPEVQQQHLIGHLTITDTREDFFKRYGSVTLKSLSEFHGLDEGNPSSIYSCLRLARENAHEVRCEITSEMWEALHGTSREMLTHQRA